MNSILNIEVPDSLLIVDLENVKKLPKRFRTTSDEIKADTKSLDLEGLRELKASGSGVFSQNGLKEIKKTIGENQNIIIVDTRKESHGYVNGMAISWYKEKNYVNKKLTSKEVQQVESHNLKQLKTMDEIKFDYFEGKSHYMEKPLKAPYTVQNEKEMVESEGCQYVRFFITDHNKPANEEIDQFVEFVKSVTENDWLHFHCRGGVGRTTSFMLMYDMMKNVDRVNKNDIFERQRIIGGRDMFKLAEGTYKHEAAVERLILLQTFYKYCKENYDTNYQTSWSEWLSENN